MPAGPSSTRTPPTGPPARTWSRSRSSPDARRSGKRKRVELRFLRSPVEIHGADRVEAITVGVNELFPDDAGARARPQHGRDRARSSAGWSCARSATWGLSIEGVPHDPGTGVIPNVEGRVVDEDGRPIPGQYVVGWIKRGPSGVIGTNKKDAQETVDAPARRRGRGTPARDRGERSRACRCCCATRGVKFVEFDGWRAIDALETDRGEPLGRPRLKLTEVDEMLDAAAGRGRWLTSPRSGR